MVESNQASGFEIMIKDTKLMTAIMLLPLLNLREMARFCQLNKASYQLMLEYVNFKVLFEVQGYNLTPAEDEEFKISPPRALKELLAK